MLREALLEGDADDAVSVMLEMENADIINDLYYAAAHTEDDLYMVLTDAVREALDYFPGEEESLLRFCVEELAGADKLEWDEPEKHYYKGDALKAYIASLRRGRKEEKKHYLGEEALKHAGLATLEKVWLNLSLEEPGERGRVFIAGNACRRALPFMDPDLTSPLIYWSSSFLSEHIPRRRRPRGDVMGYADIAYDADLMEYVCRRPGDDCGNVVFLHRAKQSLNVMGYTHISSLVRALHDSADGEREHVPHVHDTGDESFETLEDELDAGDASAAINASATTVREDFDETCRTLLRHSAGEGPWEFIVVHAACEVARTMGRRTHLPLIQAIDYMLK